MFDQVASREPYFFICSANIEDVRTTLYGTAYTDNDVVYGHQGLLEYEGHYKAVDPYKFSNGRFCLITRSGQNICVRSDYFGLEPIFFYKHNGYWAISNSFYMLCLELKRNGIVLRLNDETLASFSLLKHGLYTGQLSSNETLIKGIELLPVGKILKCSGTELHVQDVAMPLSDASRASYDDALHYALSIASRRMVGAADIAETDVFCDISGGQDSRILLGISAKSKDLQGRFMGWSNRSMPTDYATAQLVSKNLRVKLGSFGDVCDRPDGKQAYVLWSMANIGVYKPVYQPNSKQPRKMMRFSGGNFLEKNFIRDNPEDLITLLLEGIRPDIAGLARVSWENTFAALAKQPSSNSLMHKYYMQHRSRIHYGRNSYTRLQHTHMTPLISTELLEFFTTHKLDKDQVISDAMHMIDPRLLDIPFSNDKSQIPEAIKARTKENVKSRPLDAGHRLKSFGRIEQAALADDPQNSEEEFNALMLSAYETAMYSSAVRHHYSKEFLNNTLNNLRNGGDIRQSQVEASTAISMSEAERLSQ